MIDLVTLIAESLRAAFFMFWETLWALVLGFALSGAVQAFVSRTEMQRALGRESIGSIARATAFGMISSSCSYAASAMAKSLFQKGATFTAAMVFMFASTNLVIELGLVLWVLIGWQFTASEFVGGLIMIGLFALLSRFVFTPAVVTAARARLRSDGGAATTAHVAHGTDAHEGVAPQHEPWRVRLRSLAGWSDAASYTMADVTMLRREMAIGYVVAGLLAVLVSPTVWRTIFLSGHGAWTSLENVLVGPFIAVISFVCSIGNVPLAAALWRGGISFGGAISFIFADLITLPLILIYRKYYGGRLTLRLVALSWLVMSAAGLAVEYLFLALGLVPTQRPVQIAPDSLQWNYTTILNLIALVIFAALFWLSRNQARFGGGAGYAIDPVCGMQVQTAHAPATATHAGHPYYFCSDRCHERFTRDPARFTAPGAAPEGMTVPAGVPQGHGIDPVCGMSVDPAHAAASRTVDGTTYSFCSEGCATRFDADPSRFTSPECAPATDARGHAPIEAGTAVDPVCGMSVTPGRAAATRTKEGVTYAFCSEGCARTFDAAPERYATAVADSSHAPANAMSHHDHVS